MIKDFRYRTKNKLYRLGRKLNEDYIWKQTVRFDAIKQSKHRFLNMGY